MSAHRKFWFDHFANSLELYSIFPGSDWALRDLLFLGLDYLPRNRVGVKFVLDSLPVNSPKRWRDQEKTGVEFYLDIGVISMNLQIKREFDDLPRFDVFTDFNRFRVIAQGVSDEFILEGQAFYMELGVNPIYLNDRLFEL